MTGARVAIVGGGITGLTLAFTLQEEAARLGRELNLSVIDAARDMGGHARTVVDGDWLVETGPNGFLDHEPETLALVRALGLEARLVEARAESKRRFIVSRRRLCRVPDSPQSLIASNALSWRSKLRLLGEPLAPGPPAGVDETVFDFARRRIGREAADTLVDTAVSGISAGDSRTLSVRAQFPLMVEMERDHGSLVRAMLARRKRGIGPGRLLSFDRGMSTLTQALSRELRHALRPSSGVDAIAREGEGWRVRIADGRSIVADRVVLAVPAHRAAGMVRDLDPGLSFALRSIPYSGVSVVGLAYPTSAVPRALDGYGYLVARAEQLATLGVVWESSLFPGRAPAEFALMRVLLGGARRPDVLDRDEAATSALARGELAQVMGVTARPVKTWVFRWPSAIAQYTVGHLDRVADVRARARRHHGLELCGTSYDGASFNNAVAGARRSARALAADLFA